MKTFCFKLYHCDHNTILMRQINFAGLLYNHCIALHKRYYKLFGKYINANKSFTLKQAGWKLDDKQGMIRLGKKWYHYFKSRNVEGRIKTVTIKRAPVGDIYVYIVSDVSMQEIIERTGKSVGYDFGLKKFLTASDGNDIVSPLFFARSAKIIKSKNQKLSRKQESLHKRI